MPKRLTIHDQLQLGYLIVITVLFMPLAATVIFISQTADAFGELTAHQVLIAAAQEAGIAAQINAQDVNAYALGHPEHRAEYETHRDRFFEALSRLDTDSIYLTAAQHVIVDEVIALRARFDAAATALFNAADRHRESDLAGTASDMDMAWLAMDGLANELDRVIGRLVDTISGQVKLDATVIQTQITAAAVLAVAAGLAAVAIGLVVSSRTTALIVEPIRQLSVTTKQFADGYLDRRTNIRADNEIGDLARTFDSMADQISQSLVELERGVTEAFKATERAERAERIKATFLASMSHELRTPLNAVINFTRFVADGDMGAINPQQKELLGEVIVSAKHLLSLINDVLDMSKIESGSFNLFVEDQVSLHDILWSAVSVGKGLVNKKPIEVRGEIPMDLPTIRGDRQRLYQIFLNLISNAAKFTDEGEIVLTATHDGVEATISISDTGPGINESDFGSVFEAFKQAGSGLRMTGGTGLGMPISKRLAEAHGGSIRFESIEGQGSTFTVTIPIKSDGLVAALDLPGRSA